MTSAFGRGLSLRGDFQQTPTFYSSVREDTSLATINAAPNIPHSVTQRHIPRGNMISASNPAPTSQLLTRSVVAESDQAPHSFNVGAVQAECETAQGTLRISGARKLIDQEVPHACYEGLAYARNSPLLSLHGWAEENLGQLSPGIYHDACTLLRICPNVLDEKPLYWTVWDMIRLHGALIDESEITCQWGPCGDRLRVKEIRTHLVCKHGIESSSKSYKCLWPECFSSRPMSQLSSLVRHIQEHHGSVKHWPCPTCEGRFSREETLLKHFDKCPGRSKLPRRETVYGQRFA